MVLHQEAHLVDLVDIIIKIFVNTFLKRLSYNLRIGTLTTTTTPKYQAEIDRDLGMILPAFPVSLLSVKVKFLIYLSFFENINICFENRKL